MRAPAVVTRLLAAGAGALTVLAAPPVWAAVAKAEVPDWTGVWVRIGSVTDPRVDANALFGAGQSPPTDETKWPPLTDEYRARYRRIVQGMVAGRLAYDPTANCLPAGFPWMMNMPYPMEIHQTASQMTVIAEWMGQTRRIYIGPKTHADDLDPTYFGDSIAQWEGRALVVDTVGLRPDTNLNDSGLPHGPRTHVIERWTQQADGTLEDRLTIEDPDMLTQRWTRVFEYRREPTFRIREYVCENNRDGVGH